MFHISTFVRRLILFGTLFTLLQFLARAVFAVLLPVPWLERSLMFPVASAQQECWPDIVTSLPFLAGWEELALVSALISNSCLWGYGLVATVLWVTGQRSRWTY